MTHIAFHACCDTAPATAASVQSRITKAAKASFKWLKRAYRVHLQRRALLSLSEHQLRDIGLSRQDAVCEAAKPFWDLS